MMTTHRWLILLALCLVAGYGQAEAAEPRPLIVAHRGLLRHAPENTLANFRAFLEVRIGFEFDVQRTKDGHLVCIHDDTVDRTTNGKVSELTLEEIRRLDTGSWFDAKFASEKVPTIEEVLKLVAEYGKHDVQKVRQRLESTMEIPKLKNLSTNRHIHSRKEESFFLLELQDREPQKQSAEIACGLPHLLYRILIATLCSATGNVPAGSIFPNTSFENTDTWPKALSKD